MSLPKDKKITRISFGEKGAHLALCHESQGFSANNKPNALIVKAEDISITEEVVELAKSIDGKTEELTPSDNNNTPSEGVQPKVEKSLGDTMTDTDKVAEQLAELEKAKVELEKAKNELQDLVKAQQAEIEKAKAERLEAETKAKVEVVKGLGFVAGDEKQAALAVALIKVGTLDAESAKVIEETLNVAKAAVTAAITTEVGDKGQEEDANASLLKGVMAHINKTKAAK